MTVKIEFDEVKRQSNLEKHQVDFIDAALIFEAPFFKEVDDRHDYGEIRYSAVGKVDNDMFNVIYTMRGETYRIISARRAGKGDHEKYRNKTVQS